MRNGGDIRRFICECASSMERRVVLSEGIDLFDESHACDVSQLSLIEEFLFDKERGIATYQWDLIDPDQYASALKDLALNGPELMRFPEKIIDGWLALIIRNTNIIDRFSRIDGRDESGIDYIAVQECFPVQYDKEIESIKKSGNGFDSVYDNETAARNVLYDVGFFDWAKLPDGCDADSDNGVYGVRDVLERFDWDSSPSDKLIAVNLCMDVFHRRSDWASAFIKGGRSSLDKIRDARIAIARMSPDIG